MTVSSFLVAAFAGSYLGMLASAVAGLTEPFVALAAASYVFGVLLDSWRPGVAAWLHRHLDLGHGLLFLLRDVFVLVLALRSGMSGSVIAWLLGCYVALLGSRSLFAGAFAMADRRRSRPLGWRNLDLPSFELPPPPAWLTRGDERRLLYLDVLPLCGVVAVRLGAPFAVLPALATLAVLVALTFCVAVLMDNLRLRRCPDDNEVRRNVRNALAKRGPQIMFHHAGAEGSEYLVNGWLRSLERLPQPVVVFVRERVHLDRIAATKLPIVLVSRVVDLEYFQLPSLKLALYASDSWKNNHLIRLPGIKDVFIGHGDSDKAASVNPLWRMYDEVWVAGPAARERYRRADVGVRDHQIREVGRPPLAGERAAVVAPDPKGRPTVLYAPTRESVRDTRDHSSLAAMGTTIVSGLLAMQPPVRVLVKPHPRAGRRDRAHSDARAEVERMVRSAGGEHRMLDTSNGLFEAFEAADVLIGDVSSVVSDFLLTDKPYLVTNPRGDDSDEFRRAFPSTSGGYLLDPDCTGLADAVRDALESDGLAERRREVAARVHGDLGGDPMRRFRDAAGELIARQLSDDKETGFAPGWYDGRENPMPKLG